MLSAILKYAPLAVFALLAWLYVSLNEDVTALRQENTAIEHALKQQATLLEADEGYDLQKVASLTEELLAEPQNEKQEKKASIGTTVGTQLMVNKYSVDNAKEDMSGLPKTASEDTQETDDIAKKAALGELLQMKVAGQIDEKSFVEAASSLLEKDASENLPKKRVFDAEVAGGKGNIPWKRIAKGGAVAAGLAGGAALGKSLYDKYSGKSKEGN